MVEVYDEVQNALPKEVSRDLDQFEKNVDKMFLNANGGNAANKKQILTVLRELQPKVPMSVVDDMFKK